MKSTYVFSIVLLVTVLLSVSGVRAAEECTSLPPLPSYGVPVERACKINLSIDGSKFAKILAGPGDEIGGLSTDFPVTCKNGTGQCSCGDVSLNPTCLQWQYRWTITGFASGTASLSHALISAASNITVFSSDPSGAKVLQPLIARGERFLDFSVNGGTTFTASYYTPINVTPGTLTAGIVGKNGIVPLLGRCAVAGAAHLTVAQNQALPVSLTETLTTAGGCVVSFQVDPSSRKIIAGTIRLVSGSTDDCSISETDSLTIDGKNVINIAIGEWTEQGSCSYCFANTFGGKTCTTCKTCILRNGVCTKP